MPDPLLREGLVPELVCVLDPWLGVPPLPYGLAPAFVPVDPVVPLVLGTGGPVRAEAEDPTSTVPKCWLSVVLGVLDLAGLEAWGGPVGFAEAAAVARGGGVLAWRSLRRMAAF